MPAPQQRDSLNVVEVANGFTVTDNEGRSRVYVTAADLAAAVQTWASTRGADRP